MIATEECLVQLGHLPKKLAPYGNDVLQLYIPEYNIVFLGKYSSTLFPSFSHLSPFSHS